MQAKGGPVFTLSLPGGRFALLPPVIFATDYEDSMILGFRVLS